jgi:hypothetical protein
MIWSRLAKTAGLLSRWRERGTNGLYDREGKLTEEVWRANVQVAERRAKRNRRREICSSCNSSENAIF